MNIEQLHDHLTTNPHASFVRAMAKFKLSGDKIICQLISHAGVEFVTILIKEDKNGFNIKGIATDPQFRNKWYCDLLVWLVVGSFKRKLNRSLKPISRVAF